MHVARLPSKIFYTVPGQPEQNLEFPGKITAKTTTESRQVQIATRTRYFIYGVWVSNGWYPGRIDLIATLDSYTPPTLYLSLNGIVQGVAHYWANATYQLNYPPAPQWTGRISIYGSWGNIWIGGSAPLATQTVTENRCNLEISYDGQNQIIEGQWTQPCPTWRFTGGNCPPDSLDCGDCCLDCAAVKAGIDGVTATVLPYSNWRPT